MNQAQKQIESRKIGIVIDGIKKFFDGLGVFIQGFTTEQGIDDVVSVNEIPPKSASIKKLENDIQTTTISLKDNDEMKVIKVSKDKLQPRRKLSKTNTIDENEQSNEKTR